MLIRNILRLAKTIKTNRNKQISVDEFISTIWIPDLNFRYWIFVIWYFFTQLLKYREFDGIITTGKNSLIIFVNIDFWCFMSSDFLSRIAFIVVGILAMLVRIYFSRRKRKIIDKVSKDAASIFGEGKINFAIRRFILLPILIVAVVIYFINPDWNP